MAQATKIELRRLLRERHLEVSERMRSNFIITADDSKAPPKGEQIREQKRQRISCNLDKLEREMGGEGGAHRATLPREIQL